MSGIRFAQGLQVVPIYALTAGNADAESTFVKLENMQWLSFLVNVGTITNATDSVVVTVKTTAGSTDASTAAGDIAIPFWYRESSAVGGDDWGDVTYVSTGSDGLTIAATDDNKLFLIDVDPSIIPSKDADAASLYIDLDNTITSTDTVIIDIIGVFEPRYPQVEQKSSTAGAT
jgi:hypothetical protein